MKVHQDVTLDVIAEACERRATSLDNPGEPVVYGAAEDGMTYPDRHWTDDAPRPVFSTIIDATGIVPGGSVKHILAEACAMLHHLDVPADRIELLRANVGTSASYDQAVAYIEAWFPVERWKG